MSIGRTFFKSLHVSRFILGGNPFSGISHQSSSRDQEMSQYYTMDRLKETLWVAEALGINTLVARADRHIMRLLQEFWQEGGAIQWIAQTCPELGSREQGIRTAIDAGASAVFVHGGEMDQLVAQQRYDEIEKAVAVIQSAGLPAGVAGHTPRVFMWANKQLDVDFYMCAYYFYMCAYYNPTPREEHAAHDPAMTEVFDDTDRDVMVATIRHLNKPVVHYKILAAGRNCPREAFSFTGRHLRPHDAVCVGVFTKDNQQMLAENLSLFEEALQQEKIRAVI